MERHAQRALAAFGFLWAAATLFHIASLDEWGDSLRDSLLAAVAVAVLVRPKSVGLLISLATLQLYAVAIELPNVSNHWLFTAFVNLTIVASWTTVAWRRRSFAISGGELLRTFAPLVRMELVALYFFVVLHKLNTDYFDPDTSCGAGFWLLHAERFPFLPESQPFQVASLYLTVAIEAMIPILLCIGRTRSLGVLLALVFHTVIGFNPVSGFYNFSSMLYAALLLFAPEDLASRFGALWSDLRSRVQPVVRRGTSAVSRRRAILYAGLAASGLAALTLLDRAVDDHFLLVWAAYSGPLIALFVVLLRRGRKGEPGRARLFEVPDRRLLWLPLIVVLNGLNPYLGLKTEGSFSMFSNLRTEGNGTNHLLIPAATQIFGFQDDLVEVTRSSHPALDGLADRQERLPYFEFRAQASRYPTADVSYLRNGAPHRVARIGYHPELSKRPWARKLLVFRPVQREGRQQCVH